MILSIKDIDDMIDRMEARKREMPLMIYYSKMRCFDDILEEKSIFKNDDHMVDAIRYYGHLPAKWIIPKGVLHNVSV